MIENQNQIQVSYIDHMGDDLSICRAARVSFNKSPEQYTDEQNAKLIKYLVKHRHFSPLCHVAVTLHFKAPIAIHAQCAKHTVGFAMNTVSRRYVSTEPEIFQPEFRAKPEASIKQGSGDVLPDEVQTQIQIQYKQICDLAVSSYNSMIEQGVAPEQARFILPQGALTEWIWTGSLEAWARFYRLRIDSHAQKEIQELAKQVSQIIAPLFPVAWQTLIQEHEHDQN